VPLSHGGELRLVTFAWSLPDGRSIDGWGLTPDVPVRGQAAAALAAGDLVRVVAEPELDPVLAPPCATCAGWSATTWSPHGAPAAPAGPRRSLEPPRPAGRPDGAAAPRHGLDSGGNPLVA
jgi:hypothetical protein